VQEKIRKKGEKIFRGRGKKVLFARLAFCVDCGAGMNYKNDRKGYVCATYQKNGKQACQSHYIKHDDLKDKVLADLRDLATNSLNMKAQLDYSLVTSYKADEGQLCNSLLKTKYSYSRGFSVAHVKEPARLIIGVSCVRGTLPFPRYYSNE
jgi:Recombinase zinc beta ribbon domain